MAKHHQVSDYDISLVMEQFAVDADRWQHITSGDTNTSYILSKEKEPLYILSFLGRRAMDPSKLWNALAHVEANGIKAPVPRLTPSGETHLAYKGHLVVIKPFIRGECNRILPPNRMAEAGVLLGQIHSLAPLPELREWGHKRLLLDRWSARIGSACLALLHKREELQGLLPKRLIGIIDLTSREYSEWLRESIKITNHIDKMELPQGFIHGDFWSDNIVCAEDGQLVAIDWDNAGWGSFIYDIAFALNGLLQNDTGILDKKRLNDFLEGYESIRPLAEKEKKILPDALLRAAAFISVGRLYRHHILNPEPACHDPQKYGKYEETVYIGQAAKSLRFM